MRNRPEILLRSETTPILAFRSVNGPKKPMLIQILQILATCLILAYIGLAAIAYFLGPSILFPVPGAGYLPSDPGVSMLETTDGRRFAVRYYPNPEASKVIFYHHGNGEDLGYIENKMDQLHRQGFAAFAYDYPGYGHSEGRPSEEGAIATAERAYHYLIDELGWPPKDVISYGMSLGGGPAVDLATRLPFGGLVLENAFTSVFRVVTRVRLLPWDFFDNLRKISNVRCPTLIMHATEDQTVPFHHGLALLKKAPDGTRHLWVKGANHVNLSDVAGTSYWTALNDFAYSTEVVTLTH